jgi:hypothetical protein
MPSKEQYLHRHYQGDIRVSIYPRRWYQISEICGINKTYILVKINGVNLWCTSECCSRHVWDKSIFLRYNQEDVTFLNLFISITLYMFRVEPPPIIRSSDCTYSLCLLLPVGGLLNHRNAMSSTCKAACQPPLSLWSHTYYQCQWFATPPLLKFLFLFTMSLDMWLSKVKVKQSRYRPGVAQKVPGS